MYLEDSEIIRDVEVCAQMDILKVTVEFLAVTMLTILADRYLSNKTAIGVLIACVAFLCFIHRTWLIAQTRTAQENRIAVIAVCTILFAGMGALVGVILTHPSRNSLQAPNKTASKQEASPEPDSPADALARVQARTGLVPEFNDIGLGQGTKATPDGRKADGVAVLLIATIHNYGEPTSVGDYQLFVKLTDGRIEKGEPRPITPEKLKAQSLSGKPVKFSTDSLSDKTVAPILQGGSVQGRLAFFFVGGDVHIFARSGTVLRLIMNDSRNRRYAIEKPIQAVKGMY